MDDQTPTEAPSPRPGWHRHPYGGGWVQDTATVEPTAHVGPNAMVSGYAVVSDSAVVREDGLLRGHHGGHSWTVFRTADGWLMRYGCEAHPIEWWRAQDLPALSELHDHPASHARWTRAVLAMAEAMIAAHEVTP